VQVSIHSVYHMISQEGYPTYCSGGKCIYPSQNAIRHTEIVSNPEYDENARQVHGNIPSQHERFRDLGIPMFVLQIKPNMSEHTFIQDDETPVISDEMFDRLYDLVAAHKETSKKRVTNKERKPKKNNKSKSKK